MLVPSYPTDQAVETNNKERMGYFTQAWQTTLLNLLSEMNRTLSNEGFVPPTLTRDQITKIQNNVDANGNFTCQFGTTVYNSDDNTMMMAINNGSGAPIFKTVTLT